MADQLVKKGVPAPAPAPAAPDLGDIANQAFTATVDKVLTTMLGKVGPAGGPDVTQFHTHPPALPERVFGREDAMTLQTRTFDLRVLQQMVDTALNANLTPIESYGTFSRLYAPAVPADDQRSLMHTARDVGDYIRERMEARGLDPAGSVVANRTAARPGVVFLKTESPFSIAV